MKRILYILALAFPFLVTSCLIEEKDLFEQSPSERMDAFLTEYKELLESSENGWLFECYPEKDQSYGGYAYVLKFKDGNVTAYFEFADGATTSTYRMSNDDGPVISFDTYNENLLFFATPSASQYQGYQGDCEFNILGSSEDKSEIYIKGRKSRNKMTLRKFEGEDPDAYFEAQASIAEMMEAPAAKLTVNGVESACSISDNIFTYTEVKKEATETEPAETEKITCAYCFTDKGIRFYQPITIGGIEYTELLYSNETYVSEDNKVVVSLVFPPLNEQFVAGSWLLDPASSSAYALSQFSKGAAAVQKAGYPFNYLLIGDYYKGYWCINIVCGGKYLGTFNYTYTLGDNETITLISGAADGNGGAFYGWGFSEALKPFGIDAENPLTFTVTADNPRKPTVFQLTQVDNPDNMIAFEAM